MMSSVESSGVPFGSWSTMIAKCACGPVRAMSCQLQSSASAFLTQALAGIVVVSAVLATEMVRVGCVMLLARSPRLVACEAATRPIVVCPVAGAGRLSQPAMVPLTVAVSGAGRMFAWMLMVMFAPLAPIQVLGA